MAKVKIFCNNMRIFTVKYNFCRDLCIKLLDFSTILNILLDNYSTRLEIDSSFRKISDTRFESTRFFTYSNLTRIVFKECNQYSIWLDSNIKYLSNTRYSKITISYLLESTRFGKILPGPTPKWKCICKLFFVPEW